ncbi:hypothetical protein VTL71DRAFT_15307 [Oculimacula yallundae]|uniref:Uncharacterized protein n=1 Tax=Oculimacula yallundae TaxID=86028 RepID=A0ABR4CGU3_9HELO
MSIEERRVKTERDQEYQEMMLANMTEEERQAKITKDQEYRQEYDSIRSANLRRAEREAAEETYAVAKDLLYSDTTTSTTIHSGDGLMVICRKSEKVDVQSEQELINGNTYILEKFARDFIAPNLVATAGNVFWNGKKAWTPLPAVLNDGEGIYAAGKFQNQDSDARFCIFLNTLADGSRTLLLIRGIDGASIDIGSWLYLHLRKASYDTRDMTS